MGHRKLVIHHAFAGQRAAILPLLGFLALELFASALHAASESVAPSHRALDRDHRREPLL